MAHLSSLVHLSSPLAIGGMDSVYIPKLAADGSNWGVYRLRMVVMLEALALADHLTNAEVPRPESEAESFDEAEAVSRWERNDAIVKQYIAASIPDRIFILIKWCTSAKDVWDDLNTQFEAKTCGIRTDLENMLRNQRCRNNGDVRSHFARMDSLREELATAGESISNNKYVGLLLNSLPEEYGAAIQFIRTAAVLSKKDISPHTVIMFITREYEEKNSRASTRKQYRRRPQTRRREEKGNSISGEEEGQSSSRVDEVAW